MHLPERWGILQFEDSIETGASYYQDPTSELNNQHSDSRPFNVGKTVSKPQDTQHLTSFDFDFMPPAESRANR
jgi:hypothetical protein